jgi:hypothetical protein
MKGEKAHEIQKQQVDTSRKITQVRERDLPGAEMKEVEDGRK